jgi:predicted transcriptional regulator
MERMAEIFTGGSKADLILELLRHEKLSPDELATLQKIADRKNRDAS